MFVRPASPAPAFHDERTAPMAKSNKSGQSPSPGGTAALCARLAAPVAEELGLTLWDVRFLKEGASWYLRYFVDKDEGVTVDDCAALSRRLSPLLDEADPIPQSYCLEVCSPGVNRELTRPEHFEAWEGLPVNVRLYRPAENGEREIAGLLQGFADGRLTLELEDGSQRSIDKKEISLVHAIDDLEDDDWAEDTEDRSESENE